MSNRKSKSEKFLESIGIPYDKKAKQLAKKEIENENKLISKRNRFN